MKVIVCGAGQVGSNIARYLTDEGSDVTVIDSAPGQVAEVGEALDVRAMEGYASHPDVLDRAGAHEADMLVAVTLADEVNMVACQIGHSLFDIPTKIARVRNQTYLDPIYADLFAREHMPIDMVISPEIEVARAILRRLEMPGAFDMIPLADGLARLVGVTCEENCPIINTPLRQLTGLFPDLAIEVVTIIRDDHPFVPGGDDQMLAGDQVYFVADRDHVRRAMTVFGHEEPEARRVAILGGGNVGLFLAREMARRYPGVKLRIVEGNRDRARYIARELKGVTVIHGDALDTAILAEARIDSTEAVVAVTNDDESNILASLLAKRHGCQRAITLINRADYTALIGVLGIDAAVNPRASTVSTILQHIRRGRIKAAHSLREGFAEILEGEALETSPLTNVPIREARMPSGVKIGAILRGGREVIIPRPNTVIRPGDRVIVLAEVGQVRKVERMFSVRLEFF